MFKFVKTSNVKSKPSIESNVESKPRIESINPNVGRAPPGRQRRNNWMPTASSGQDEAYNQVCNFLKDDEVGMVGIYGMGGVGKTTLMKKIEREFLKPSHFVVISVVVSRAVDMDMIQEVIMGNLNLAFNKDDDPYSRADKINDALGRNKVAILFDDIWECLDLEKLGILGQENLDTRSFKLIFTTRSKAVCEKMQSDELINVQPLGWDDSWALFKRSVGGKNDIESWDSSILALAKEVAIECKGLPLALKVIGGAMACRGRLEEWTHALATLRGCPADIPEAEEYLFPPLKFSFDSLSNRREKDCFLYTCFYPEDKVIEADELIECWIGEGILTLNGSYQEARDEGKNIFRTLQDVCLFETLQDSPFSSRIHVVIRDMGIWIANSHDITDKTESCQYSVWCEDSELPEEAIGSNLTTLIFGRKCGGRISCNFSRFTSMSKLRVIKLKGVKFDGIPTSIGELTELRHLELIETNLERLPDEIRNLRKLLVMHFLNFEVNIDLPEAIGELTELRRVVCSTRNIPTEIGNLHKLEELVIDKSEIEDLPKTVGRLTELRKLDVCVRRLPVEVGNLKKLEELRIDSSLVEFPQVICQLVNLKNLFLKIEAHLELPIGLENLNKLEIFELDEGDSFDCSSHCVEVIPNDTFRNMHKLRELRLPIRNFKILPPSFFQGLTSLKKLSFRYQGSDSDEDEIVEEDDIVEEDAHMYDEDEIVEEDDIVEEDEFIEEDEMVEEDDVGYFLTQSSSLPLRILKIEGCRIKKFQVPPTSNDLCFPWLEELRICHFDRLEKMQVMSQMAFPSIRVLDITGCDSLEHISGLEHLQSLVELKIGSCKKLEEVIQVAGDKTLWDHSPGICFPKLEKLDLSSLPQLKSICSDAISFPSLREFRLNDCPELRVLPRGLEHLQSLVELEIRHCRKLEEVIQVAGDKTLWDHSPGICFPKLEKLWLRNLPQLKSICSDAISFPSLRNFRLGVCPKLRVLPRGLEHLQSLVELKICYCQKLEEVIQVAGDKTLWDHSPGICFPKLEKLQLEFLPQLKSICSDAISFPSLHDFHLDNCPELRVLPRGLVKENRAPEDEDFKAALHPHFLIQRDDESEDDLSEEYTPFGEAVFVSDDEEDDQLQLSEEYTPFGEAVFGREQDKEIVKNLLLSAGETEENYSFVAIAGKEGMGKTTLARIVFNDIIIMRTFDVRSWACVSNSSKFETIVKQLLESATNEKCPQLSSLNELEHQLQLLVHSKQCLLVLDGDGLDRSPALESILSSLKYCGEGTKIVVTVSNEEVAHAINNCVSHCLLPLLDDGCWRLFMAGKNFFGQYYPMKECQMITKEIITKCEGVPLAVKLLVGILERQDIETLDSVVSNDIQNFIHIEVGISNAWRTIYGYLPDHLKSCLEYFTLFSNYFVSEDTLLGLWVAEGFVLQSIDYSEMFSSASEVLAELQYRCLINKDISMHNVIRHLVRSACSKFYYQLDKAPYEGAEKITHASLLGRMIEEKDVEWLLRAKGLCTIFLEFRPNEFLDRLVNWKSLRVICLSEADEMELPSSIGDLEQLRYLRIYKCGITSLPNSICSLSNLQSLEVEQCRDIYCLPEKFGNLMNLCRLNLRKTAINCLPSSFYNLSNLRDLNLSETGICSLPDSFYALSRLEKLNIRLCHNLSWLPQQFGSLTQLRCLSDYPVRQRGSWGGISELKDLNKLEGILCISNLGNIGSKKEAESAHLEYKEGLRELIFQWSTQQSTSTLAFEGQTDLDIAQGLRPPGNVRSLSFVNYYADRFPEWMSNKDFFPFLHNLSFSSCSRVKILGLPCGNIARVEIRDCLQLMSLNVEGGERTIVKIDELIIVDCPNLESIGSLCTRRNLHIQGCNKLQISLQTLVTSMVDLESIRQLNIYCDSIFLTFKQLCVIGNPNLSLLPGRLTNFTSLRVVELDDCPLLESIALPPNIIKLRIANCPLLQYLPTTMLMLKSLRSLKIHNLPLLQNLRSDAIPPNLVKLHVTDCLIVGISPQAEFLQVLHIHGCPNLKSITDEELPGSLVELAIHDCQSLESLSNQGVYNLANLQILQLTNCGKLSLLPGALLSLTFLKELRIDYSPILVSGLPSTLEKLKMWGYENLQCFPQQDLLQNLSSLQRLKIVEFPQLEPLVKELPSSLKQLSICDCPALTILNIDVVRLNSLKKLKIMNCHFLELFGENGLPSMLVELKIMNCEKLKYLPKNLITLTCLESISIFSCPELELQPENRLPKNLSMLKVIDCPRLILEGKEGACSTWSMKHIPFRYFA